MKVTFASLIAVASASLSGHYKGSVPLIIDVEATFTGDSKADILVDVKVAKKKFDCKGEAISESDAEVTFPSVAAEGDCMGDAVRSDNKDPTKYTITKNGDGTLTFNSDGYPAMKMKATSVSQLSMDVSADEPCCKTCAEPLKKYYSVDRSHGFCGEACMDPSKFSLYKVFEWNLTLSESLFPCSEQFTPTGTHYNKYSETVTHGVPGLLAVTLDLYAPGLQSSVEVGDNTCSADIGHCGEAYQACCIGYGATGFPCGCHLADGEGSSVGDCGTCGAAYQLCCDGYKAKGFPCNCNVADAGFSGFSV